MKVQDIYQNIVAMFCKPINWTLHESIIMVLKTFSEVKKETHGHQISA